MLVLRRYAVAVVFCVITMLCWGSWANTQKLAGETWRSAAAAGTSSPIYGRPSPPISARHCSAA